MGELMDGDGFKRSMEEYTEPVSEGGPGSPGRKAQPKRVKNKVVCVFLLEQTPEVSTARLLDDPK
jgi:hypothetical protein